MMLLTPTEILSKYPGIKKVWQPADLGYLLRLGLVRGKKLHRGCKIEEKDVQKVFTFIVST